ncbi:prophage LambdaBa01 [Geomicrobium sp. JCM 19037]|nr:prophage LambdaBa01 [Geomicrobium sp. JCM 19037]
MLDLIIEYKVKLKELKEYRETLERKPVETKAAWTQLKHEKSEHEIVGDAISSLEYAIEWMVTSRKPGAKRDIDRRSVHQRTVYMDPDKLERLQHNVVEHTEISEVEHNRLDDALSVLTEREREVYVMCKAEMLSMEQAGRYLGVCKGTVQKTVGRAEAKVNNQINTSLFSFVG